MRSVEEIKADIKRHENRLGNLDFNQDDERCHIQIAEHELRWTLTSAIPLDRLEAICAAEREGRCVVLPCKVCDTAYALLDDSNAPGGWYICGYLVWGVCLKEDGWYLLDSDGNADKIGTDYAYLTRAEAEEALRQK